MGAHSLHAARGSVEGHVPPLYFDLDVYALAMLLDKARGTGLIKRVLTENVVGGINMLQYADEAIFLLQDDYNSAHNLKFVLCLFEQISGLKINFHKNELFLFGDAINKVDEYTRIFTCPIGSLPMRYLGLLVDEKKNRNKNWKPPEDKMERSVVTGNEDYLPVLVGSP